MDRFHRLRDQAPGHRSVMVLVALATLLLLSACEPIEDQGLHGRPARRTPSVPQPTVQHDLQEIRDHGTLRMLTSYNAISYFVHRGGEAGFDYELCQRFARALDLGLEVVIPEAGEDMISLLNSGRADVICAGLPLTAELARYVDATRPVAMVQKVVVRPAGEAPLANLADLNGLTITVASRDPYLDELKQWRDEQGLDFTVLPGMPLMETEEIIALVSRRELPATVADDAVVEAARSYLSGEVVTSAVLGEPRPLVWLVRRNSPELRDALNSYLKANFRVSAETGSWRSQTYGIIYDRYFRNTRTIRTFQREEARPDKSGRISPYDELVRAAAESLGLDWRLVTALIYQESRFFERAESQAGARGLMQVMPHLGGPESDSLFVPTANIRAGLRLLHGAWRGLSYLDSLERTRFSLAEYHAGIGHVADARRLAMDKGLNPNAWVGGLAETLPRLAQRRWYTNTRHGYYRGDETVRYVEEITNRARMYTRLVPRDPTAPAPTDSMAVADSLAAADADSAAFAAMPDDERPGPK